MEGLLTTQETKKAELFWVKQVQAQATADGRYHEDKLQLNPEPNRDGVVECWGRVHYPILLPDGQCHSKSTLTMAKHLSVHPNGLSK